MIAPQSRALELADHDVVDLSHAYNNETLYWPTAPSRVVALVPK